MAPQTPAVFHVLLALADAERHGYGIMREVAGRTNSQVIMGPGTLYGTIKRMLGAGLIEECGERSDPELNDERRRYYRLTGEGRRVAKLEAERIDRLAAWARTKRLLGRPQLA